LENYQTELRESEWLCGPFVPAGNPDIRLTHAQEYSAFYLGEISTHLEKLAASADKMERTLKVFCRGRPQSA
jgi:hypothetical protein